MPLGVALSELRYELRAETYASLLPAHGLSSVDMQNVILARAQRELWNQYIWPHLEYRIDFTQPANNSIVAYQATMPFENIISLWYFYTSNTPPNAFQLRYGYEDSIVPGRVGYPPQRWRHIALVDPASGLTNISGEAQIWPVPNAPCYMRWKGQAPLNSLKVDTDVCMIDSTAIVLTAAAELLGAQKGETAALKGQKAQTYIRRLLGRSGANKRDISALGQGRENQSNSWQRATPYLDYIPGP